MERGWVDLHYSLNNWKKPQKYKINVVIIVNIIKIFNIFCRGPLITDRNPDPVKGDIRQLFLACVIPGEYSRDKNRNENKIGKKMPFGEVRDKSLEHILFDYVKKININRNTNRNAYILS